MRTARYYWSVVLVCTMLLWGTSTPIIKLISKDVSAFEILFLRFLSASIVLIPFLLPNGKQFIKSIREAWVTLLIFGAMTFVSALLVIKGIAASTAINGAILINLNPLFVVLIAPIVLSEHLHVRQIVFLFIGFLGTVITILNGAPLSTFLHSSNFRGSMYLLSAASIVACIVTYSKPYIQRYGSLEVTFSMITIAAIAGFFTLSIQGSLSNILAIPQTALIGNIFLGAGATALPWVLFGIAITHMHAAQASAFKLLIPIIASGYAAFFLGEQLTLWLIAGMLLTGLGVYGCIREEKKNIV